MHGSDNRPASVFLKLNACAGGSMAKGLQQVFWGNTIEIWFSICTLGSGDVALLITAVAVKEYAEENKEEDTAQSYTEGDEDDDASGFLFTWYQTVSTTFLK